MASRSAGRGMVAACSPRNRCRASASRSPACLRKIPTALCTTGTGSAASRAAIAKPPARSASLPDRVKNSGAVIAVRRRSGSLASREPVQRLQVAPRQVAADDPRGGAVDHVPGGDPVVPPQVDLVQLAPLVLGQPALRLESRGCRTPPSGARTRRGPAGARARPAGDRDGPWRRRRDHPSAGRWPPRPRAAACAVSRVRSRWRGGRDRRRPDSRSWCERRGLAAPRISLVASTWLTTLDLSI